MKNRLRGMFDDIVAPAPEDKPAASGLPWVEGLPSTGPAGILLPSQVQAAWHLFNRDGFDGMLHVYEVYLVMCQKLGEAQRRVTELEAEQRG